jgi:YVTN family beta-propeller protein
MSLFGVARVSAIGTLLIGAALLSGALGATPKLAPLAISQTLRTASDPGAIAIDTLRSRAYVTDSRENTLYVFDLASAQPVAFIPTGRQPHQVALVGSKAYVSNFTDQTLTVIDTATDQATKTLAIGGLGIAANAQTHRLFVAGGSRIWVLDTNTDTLAATIDAPSGASIWGLAADPASGRLYATDANQPRVLVFAVDGSTSGSVALDAPARFAIVVGAAGRVLVAGYTDKDPRLTTIDGASRIVLSRVATVPFAGSLAVHPTSGLVYAASDAQRSVTAIDAAIRGAVASATTAARTGGVAISPLSGEPIVATAGGSAPPARALVAPLPVVRP